MRTALVPTGSGSRAVAQIVMAGDDYQPPDGMEAVASDTANEGDIFDGKAFSAAPLPDLSDAELSALKDLLCQRIDARAEALRNTLITPGSGQAMEYQESYAQARAALAQDAAHAADDTKPAVSVGDPAFVLLAATVGSDIDPETGKPATDVLGVARSVKAAYEAYLAAGAAIKRVRIDGKAAVRAAASREAAEAALAGISWPTFG